MKRVIIVRHGKTEELYSGITDFERKLLKRGKTDAEKISRLLRKNGNSPNIFISSPAKRARQTAAIFAKEFDFREENIIIKDFIYGTYTTAEFLRPIQETDDSHKMIILFGHNPGFANIIFRLTRSFPGHLPTCGAAGIDFETNSWKEVEAGKGKLVFFEYPKKTE
jgi:phosphohistidine phosphatase